MPPSFIRFVTAETDDDSGALQGLFQAAYRLRNSADAPSHVVEEMNDALAWFDAHLSNPLVYRPRGIDRRRAICWFKEAAVEHVQHAQRLAAVLRRNGIEVRELRTRTPGHVVKEDVHQVFAAPFRDTVMPRRKLAR